MAPGEDAHLMYMPLPTCLPNGSRGYFQPNAFRKPAQPSNNRAPKFEKYTRVVIKANDETAVRQLSSCRGYISQVPEHPNTWYEVTLPGNRTVKLRSSTLEVDPEHQLNECAQLEPRTISAEMHQMPPTGSTWSQTRATSPPNPSSMVCLQTPPQMPYQPASFSTPVLQSEMMRSMDFPSLSSVNRSLPPTSFMAISAPSSCRTFDATAPSVAQSTTKLSTLQATSGCPPSHGDIHQRSVERTGFLCIEPPASHFSPIQNADKNGDTKLCCQSVEASASPADHLEYNTPSGTPHGRTQSGHWSNAKAPNGTLQGQGGPHCPWLNQQVVVIRGKGEGQQGVVTRSGHGFYCVQVGCETLMKRGNELELLGGGSFNARTVAQERSSPKLEGKACSSNVRVANCDSQASNVTLNYNATGSLLRCETCLCWHDGGFGSGRFCSKSCSGRFAVKTRYLSEDVSPPCLSSSRKFNGKQHADGTSAVDVEDTKAAQALLKIMAGMGADEDGEECGEADFGTEYMQKQEEDMQPLQKRLKVENQGMELDQQEDDSDEVHTTARYDSCCSSSVVHEDSCDGALLVGLQGGVNKETDGRGTYTSESSVDGGDNASDIL